MSAPPRAESTGSPGQARAPPVRVRHSISRETWPPRAGLTPLRPAEAAPPRAGLRLRPPRPPESHTPPRVPSRAVGLQTAQRLTRSRCSRRGSGSFPLQRCLVASNSAGAALRITSGRQTEFHTPRKGGSGGKGRRGRGEPAEIAAAGTRVLAIVPRSSAGSAGIFKLSVKEGGGREREEREAGPGRADHLQKFGSLPLRGAGGEKDYESHSALRVKPPWRPRRRAPCAVGSGSLRGGSRRALPAASGLRLQADSLVTLSCVPASWG